MSDLTRLLQDAGQGRKQADDELLSLVYRELRQLAAARLAHERPGQTLQATALVHEAYLRLLGGKSQQEWGSRGHFFAAAAEAMRRILVETARRKNSLKGGGRWRRHDLELTAPTVGETNVDLLAVDEALSELARSEPLKAELVKLRYFAGLTLDEAAEALGVSSATADRYWKYARAWLANRLRDEDAAEGESR